MTREEAILLSAYTGFLLVPDFSEVHKFCEDALGHPIWTHEFADSCVQKEIQEKLRPQIMELIQNISALLPVSREQVEKVRGEWIDCDGGKVPVDKYGQPFGWAMCSACGEYLTASDEYPCTGHFCPNCGAPMTDKAVQMVMERMEALGYGKDD